VLGACTLALAVTMLHDCAAAGGIVIHSLDDEDEFKAADPRPALTTLEPLLTQNGNGANGAHHPGEIVVNGHGTNGANGSHSPKVAELNTPEEE
jgi:hypothetical protein